MASKLDSAALRADLIVQVRVIEQDLIDQFNRGELPEELVELRSAHTKATAANRTAADFDTWRAGEVTQSAVAWVLGTVFVRWCEDNELITPMLSGRGHRMADAQDTQSAYFRTHKDHTDRHWLQVCFDALGSKDDGVVLFDPAHNHAYRLPISHDGAKELIAFWRKRRADGELVHYFRDDAWETGFLGDLYQSLSERARNQFALLQTPEFVRHFILKYTLEPALAEFGHEGLRVIDPTCGSGHFLLDAFDRLAKAWQGDARAANDTEVARRALDSVHGVDVNPFAVAIARFRLMLAAWKTAGVTTIERAARHRWKVTIATGDSLLANRRETLEGMDVEAGLQLATEDTDKFPTLLDIGSYHVVVGNPPYITVKDVVLNREYRRYYFACHRQYQLTVPFAQRFFELARPAEDDGRGAGYVGQITSNAFMKREFGTKLIEDFLPRVDLTRVIDTSGAYIPGHGTPTVILFGRHRRPNPDGTVRAVLGIRGEPSEPRVPAKGHVWLAIESQVDSPGSDSDWVSVLDLSRSRLAGHPWSLSGGGANQLFSYIENGCVATLSERVNQIGFSAITGEDESFELPARVARRIRLPSRGFGTGDIVRDWVCVPVSDVIWMYEGDFSMVRGDFAIRCAHYLWPRRVSLLSRKRFGTAVKDISGFVWWAYREFYPKKLTGQYLITFPFVSTHNHFVLDRGGNVFIRTAPVIKLREDATEGDHLQLLGVLNSSTACFWLKQVCHDKGSQSGTGGFMHDKWEPFYEFTGTKLERFPLPDALPLERARRLDDMAQQLTVGVPQSVAMQAPPSRERLAEAKAKYLHLRARMIAEQEELDWDVYQRYGLLSESEAVAVVIPDPATVPPLNLGERAFEIILARRVAAGETDTQWFARHGSTPITELPKHWPDGYRRIIQARISLIEKRRDLALIERPECKRRWSAEDWDAQAGRAVREWLQDRLEAEHLWFAEDELGARQPVPRSVAELADVVRPDTEWGAVAAMWAADFLGRPDADIAEIAAALVDDEHVPYLAAYRYKGNGLTNRKAWEHVWEQQRVEDQIAAEMGLEVTAPPVREAVKNKIGTIRVPPKYGSADFARPSYWRHRGKLDVPKERFISYPGASLDGDGSLLLGWAGWDHREQAHALAVTITHRRTEAGWGTDRLLPLLAGLAEVLPWVRQWHIEIDPAYGTSPADAYDGFLDTQLADLDLGPADLQIPHGRVDVSPLPGRRRGTRQDTRRRQPAEPPLDPAQKATVLEFADSMPITTAQVAELLGVATKSAQALVRRLVADGDLVRSGERRGARYHLPGRK